MALRLYTLLATGSTKMFYLVYWSMAVPLVPAVVPAALARGRREPAGAAAGGGCRRRRAGSLACR